LSKQIKEEEQANDTCIQMEIYYNMRTLESVEAYTRGAGYS
jgi:hypothetical protein